MLNLKPGALQPDFRTSSDKLVSPKPFADRPNQHLTLQVDEDDDEDDDVDDDEEEVYNTAYLVKGDGQPTKDDAEDASDFDEDAEGPDEDDDFEEEDEDEEGGLSESRSLVLRFADIHQGA